MHSARLLPTISLALALMAGLPAPADGHPSAMSLSQAEVKILPSAKASPVGDVNGDGHPDIAAAFCEPDRPQSVWVLFGPFSQARIDLNDPKIPGFEIKAGEASACVSARAGDVNGDGLSDILVGAPGADVPGGADTGRVYVVFGKTTTEPVDLAEFDQYGQGLKGFRIDGAFRLNLVGNHNIMSTAGDVNGDGLDDVVLGAPFAGSAYVVFGKRDPLPIDLLTFELGIQGPLGYRIDTPVPDFNSDYAVSGVGDVNGDGIPDVAVGLLPREFSPGRVFVVYGKPDSLPIGVREPGGWGFSIKGAPGDCAGKALAGAGDVNNDGLGDVVIGGGCGRAYVLFGKKDTKTIKLARLGKGGYVIEGTLFDGTGRSVANAGDINGDGLPDAIVGASSAAGKKGAAYIVYGKKSSTAVRLGRLGTNGYALHGEERFDWAGSIVGGPGDVNGDGIPDVMTCGWGANACYLVWGRR